MLIYTHQISNRLKYATDVFFGGMMGVEVNLTTSLAEFNAHQGSKLNYSDDPSLPGLHIPPAALLFEKGIREQQLQVGVWKEIPVLFSSNSEAKVSFDPLAASFYLLSRYEEYLPHRSDRYGRYLPENSVALKEGFLHRPIVNIWAREVASKIAQIYPSFTTAERNFKVVSTVDIDNAFAYRQKGFMRTLGGFAKDVTQFDFDNFKKRFLSVMGRYDDPFDTYEELNRMHKDYPVKAVYFFLLADYAHNDKGVSYRSKNFQKLIKSIGDYHDIGIHPGFQSNFHPQRLVKEVKRLEKISHREVVRSRQHFLMMKFPDTYRRLLGLGITSDYSMGYAQLPGFRAGTCDPYPFYDLDAEVSTTLILHPFTVMDATLNLYMELKPQEAIAQTKKLIEEVKAVNGTFMTLWHNETLGEHWAWKGWSGVLEAILKEASS
jgi:hypothetical protein